VSDKMLQMKQRQKLQKTNDPSGLGLYEDETVRADSNLQQSPKINYITST